MTQNVKYILIAAVVAGVAFFLWKKYKAVKKPQ